MIIESPYVAMRKVSQANLETKEATHIPGISERKKYADGRCNKEIYSVTMLVIPAFPANSQSAFIRANHQPPLEVLVAN